VLGDVLMRLGFTHAGRARRTSPHEHTRRHMSTTVGLGDYGYGAFGAYHEGSACGEWA
jgi:hypothetical protein